MTTFELDLDIHLENKMLSVIFDSDSFFYSLSDEEGNLGRICRYNFKKKNSDDVLSEIRKDPFLDQEFTKINFVSNSRKFTFLPSSEFYEDSLYSYAKFGYGESKTSITRTLKKDNINIVFESPSQLLEELGLINDHSNIFHIAEAWHQLFIEDGIYVFLEKNRISIYAIIESDFRFFNIFEQRSLEDCLYFLMLTFKELHLDIKRTEVFLSGHQEILKGAKLLLEQYIRIVSIFDFGFNNFNGDPSILDLYAASLCE